MFEFTWNSYKNHSSRYIVKKLSESLIKQETASKML